MIYTVTFNPALDYSTVVENLMPGLTNRSTCEGITFGGKGLNVSTVLNNLGIENIALGFIAGFTGGEIKRLFEQSGGKGEFIALNVGLSRINVKIKGSTETEINASGPVIDDEALDALIKRLDLLECGDTLVLAGSIPSSVPKSVYADITKRISPKGVRVIVDATGELLVNTLSYKPYLIKPNNHELGEIFDVEIKTREQAAVYAKRLREMGAENVLVSMGAGGAVLAANNGEVLIAEAPCGTAVNSVGAGDSMVAGFIAGISHGDIGYAFRLGIAAGSATAFSSELATKDEVYKLMNN